MHENVLRGCACLSQAFPVHGVAPAGFSFTVFLAPRSFSLSSAAISLVCSPCGLLSLVLIVCPAPWFVEWGIFERDTRGWHDAPALQCPGCLFSRVEYWSGWFVGLIFDSGSAQSRVRLLCWSRGFVGLLNHPLIAFLVCASVCRIRWSRF